MISGSTLPIGILPSRETIDGRGSSPSPSSQLLAMRADGRGFTGIVRQFEMKY